MRLHSPQESLAWLRVLTEHWRNVRVTRARLEAEQRRKFRKLTRFLAENSPYYRELMAEHGLRPGTCTPEGFPVLTKQCFIDNFDRISTNPRVTQAGILDFLSRSTNPKHLFQNKLHVLHTSGTSGTVAYFAFSHDEWIRGSSHIARLVRIGIRKRIAYVAAVRGHFAGVSLILTGNDGSCELFYNVRTFDVNLPIEQIVDALNRFQPQVLTGYAAILKVLADRRGEGLLRISPSLVVNGGEPLRPESKAYIESAFGSPVANVYASSEHLYMGIAFPNADGMYLLEDDLIFEFHDDHTCVTNLFNYTTPLIRYRMDDVIIPDLDSPAVYPFTKVKELIGRHEDALVFENRHGVSDFIHPIVILEIFVQGLRAWQIAWLDKMSFLFRACFEAGLTEAQKTIAHRRIRETLMRILVEKEMDNVTFEVEEAESLGIDKQSGKFRMIVRENGRLAATRSSGPVAAVPARAGVTV